MNRPIILAAFFAYFLLNMPIQANPAKDFGNSAMDEICISLTHAKTVEKTIDGFINIQINQNTRIKNDFEWLFPANAYVGFSIKIKF